MLFSSAIFLFAFLPVCFFFYYVVFRKSRLWQNIFLFVASLIFYAWGEPICVLLMILSIFINWLCALMISVSKKRSAKRSWLVASLVANIGMLFAFKYYSFTLTNLNALFALDLAIPKIALPLGISFFTFQAMSYVIDVYRGDGCVQKNPMYVGLYISLFPQLVAGPIVRYQTVADQILYRQESVAQFSGGIRRFIFGFGKKLILSNGLAIVADHAFQADQISCPMAWLGMIAYTLQIFFDFSGYSDMAIGLGKMFGFEFEENFNYPYISKTISEFWRRWHISMGTWFRDYVYFPLGGSRVKTGRLILNLLVVWALTGLWHGADWTFVLWGLFFFVIIVLEKLLKIEKRKFSLPIRIGQHAVTLLLVMFGWVLFRADTLSDAISYYAALFRFSDVADPTTFLYFRGHLYILAISVFACLPIKNWISKWTNRIPVLDWTLKTGLSAVILLISLIYMVKTSYSPFIYFNF